MPPVPFRIDGDIARFQESSGYAGAEGLSRFLECAGLVRSCTDISLVELALGAKLPQSLRDLIEAGGSISRDGMFANDPSKIVWLSSCKFNHIDILKLYTTGQFDRTYDWRNSRDFAHNYCDRGRLDHSIYAATEWIQGLLLIHEERNGALLLANPYVRTVDDEWEAWLWSHRFPGAYRFRSVAGLVAHMFLEIQHDRVEDPRFDESQTGATCARHLFKQA